MPYEILNKKFRIAQKTLDREYNHFQNATSELEKGLESNGNAGELTRLLSGVVEKLQVLKRKSEESITEELSAGYVCKRRLDHIKNFMPLPSPNLELQLAATNQWKQTRLDRMLIEHFLRLGYYESAEQLALRSGIRDLTNLDIFQVSREVEAELGEHRTGKFTAWCNENKTKLRKINSTIEFQLRVQEFVELIRLERRMDAVKHAQRYFGDFPEQLAEIRQYMALLAFPAATKLEPYKTLFDPNRWQALILNFRNENYRLFQLAAQSVLAVTVQAGLSALKTPQCYAATETQRNVNCPVCQPLFNEVANHLPFSHFAQSRLMCRVTGKPLNEHNLPMMLPNGQILGQLAVTELAKPDGALVCPITNQAFVQPKIEKVFVM